MHLSMVGVAAAAVSSSSVFSCRKSGLNKVCLFHLRHFSQSSPSCLSSSFSSSIYISLILLHYANANHCTRIRPLRPRQLSFLRAAASCSQETTQCVDSSSSANNNGEVETESEHSPILEEIGLSRTEVKLLLLKNPYILDRNPASTITNVHALQALGITGDHLILLVKKRPSIFIANLEPIVTSIQQNIQGFDLVKFHKVLFKADHQLLVNFPEKVNMLLRHGLPSYQLANVLNNLNLKVFCEKPIEELDKVICFLKQYDTNNETCGLIIRRSALLQLSLEKDLVPRTSFFEKLGADQDSLKKLFRRFPLILAYTVEHFEKHVAYLKSVGFTEENVLMMVKAYPQTLSLSIERKMKPRIEFLKNCGLNQQEVAKLLIRHPTFLGLSFDDNLSKKVALLLKVGFESYSCELAQALSTVTRTSYEKMQITVDLLLSYGLSYEDICYMGKRQPHFLRYSPESIKPKIDYLVNDMSRSIHDLISFPAFLGYSLEDRIKPRHEMMKWLISRGLAKEDFSVNRLLAVSDKDFLAMSSAFFAFGHAIAKCLWNCSCKKLAKQSYKSKNIAASSPHSMASQDLTPYSHTELSKALLQGQAHFIGQHKEVKSRVVLGDHLAESIRRYKRKALLVEGLLSFFLMSGEKVYMDRVRGNILVYCLSNGYFTSLFKGEEDALAILEGVPSGLPPQRISISSCIDAIGSCKCNGQKTRANGLLSEERYGKLKEKKMLIVYWEKRFTKVAIQGLATVPQNGMAVLLLSPTGLHSEFWGCRSPIAGMGSTRCICENHK
eukprot:Gb_07257 [translate_table: standard]